MLKKKNKPEIIKLSPENFDGIQGRLASSSLDAEDKKIISTILITYQWLIKQLQTAKFSIQKLKSIFGFRTEKMKNLRTSNPGNLNFSAACEGNTALPESSKIAANEASTPPKKQ